LQQRTEDAGDDFSRLVSRIRNEARFSVNCKPASLVRILEGEDWLNAFEFAEREATRRGVTPDEALREKLGEFYERRLAFEDRAGAGRHFYYGALNAGGMGAPGYGRLCVVFGPCGGRDDEVVWLSHDSLKGAWFAEGRADLDWNILSRAVADNESVQVLAAVKCFDLRLAVEDSLAPLCGDNDFVEGLSLRRLDLEEAAEIRSATDDEVHLRALNALLHNAPADEQLDLGMHERVRSLAEGRGIPWVAVQT
jgi:hypothetical protein